MGESQQTIPGTADVPSAKVENAAKVYTKLLATWQALGKLCIEKQAELGGMMEADEIEKFEIEKPNVTELVAFILSDKMKLPRAGAYDVVLETTATTKVKVKTQKEES